MNSKKISVIMSAYNAAHHIEQAIQSIQAQDITNWELIFVDDGSTDSTYPIIEHFATSDDRFFLLRNDTNLGIATSLNKALSQAKGDLIARMDSDDTCHPERLARQMRFMELRPEIDVIGTGAIEVDITGRLLGVIYRREHHEDMVANIYRENPFIHPSIMARRKFFESLGGYNTSLKRAQDYDLWLRGYKNYCYYNIQEPMIYYTRRKGTLKSALYASRVLLEAILREKSLERNGKYVLRPITAFLVQKLIGKAIYEPKI